MKAIQTMMMAAAMVLAIGSAANAETIYAVTQSGLLISFNSNQPSAILTGAPISGLANNEVIQGIDFRPATGELFAVGSFSNLYTINPATSAASLVGAGSFSPGLNGAWFGFDFNPTIDRIRNVSDANQNLVLNPNTGAVQLAATDLFYTAGDPNEGADPTIAHSAYTNNFLGAVTSQLYGIDVDLNILVTQANNTGVLATVGPLGIDVGSAGGFDISGTSGKAFAALQPVGGNSNLYTIDLATGNTTLLGTIAGGLTVTAMSVLPEPTSLALLGLAACVAIRRRR